MFRLLLACFVICGTVILSLRADAVEKAAAAHKPNVVLIMADDVSWEAFSCYGAEDYKTPHIDSLAARGIRFAHCYSTPICTPSRVQIMTGQYSFRNYTHFGYLSPNEKTIGHLMQSAGYQTAIAGKWQLNGLYNKLPGWEDRKRPQKAGFHESYLWQVTTGKQLKDGGGERFWSPPLERNGVMETVEDNAGKYGPDLLCDFLCDFMERNRSKPFFVYYPMVLVHNPFVKTPDTIGDDPRTQAANKAPKNKTQQKENFVAMVEYMDKIIGRLVKKVESIGQEENTIIVFTADNGTNRGITSRWHGQDIKGGKGGMKDMGTHAPLVASWPGRSPQAAVIDDLVDFTDMYPTFADAAGVSLGKDDPIDGRSFLPQLLGQPGHREALCFYITSHTGAHSLGNLPERNSTSCIEMAVFLMCRKILKNRMIFIQAIWGVGAAKAKQMLTSVLNQAPPAPTEPGSRTTVDRPTYADWPRITDKF